MDTEFDSLPLFAQTPTPLAASLQRVAQAVAPPRPAPAAEPPAPIQARPLSVEEADALRRGIPATGPVVEESHREAALRWMEEHPDAVSLFETLAMQAAARGRKFGMKALTERVRWEFLITRDEGTWKLNNNHTAYVARELVRRHPHLAEHIEFRRASGE